jgi:hypothetical protein
MHLNQIMDWLYLNHSKQLSENFYIFYDGKNIKALEALLKELLENKRYGIRIFLSKSQKNSPEHSYSEIALRNIEVKDIYYNGAYSTYLQEWGVFVAVINYAALAYGYASVPKSLQDGSIFHNSDFNNAIDEYLTWVNSLANSLKQSILEG